ncbi:hypothetical protein [Actinomadura macrotermitis]|uniref:Lipoprotein n=1 Tax=Actinomadura macrotermitis TaxID=2585200 RepID=A0A7K0C8Q0_9ACTN|nr:hypothetical protein [Actinomadura macrotermitis]MQY09830.1 hypothetical protein [Actinomadura macrotermitis]
MRFGYVVAAVAAGALTACGPAAEQGPEQTRAASAAPSSGAGAARPEAGLTAQQVRQALPDRYAMGAWEPVTAGVTGASGHLGCPSDQQCKGRWFGHVKWRLNNGLTVTFQMTTFGAKADADEHYRQQAARFAGYEPLKAEGTFGEGSHAYARTAGGLKGYYLTTHVGAVVATVIVERGGYEVTLPQTAGMFVKRIRQAEAGHKPDATLPRE